MAFDALEVALELVRALRAPLAVLRQHDRKLAELATDAVNSVALCLDEGRRRRGKDRLHLFRVAAGSAAETRTALRLAEAWGYLGPEALAYPYALLDRELAMLWRLAPPT
jgi:four helix bundle protein